jgi:hypothetical protein
MNVLQDNNGNYSSMRVILILTFSLMLWMFVEWRIAFHIEIEKDNPDYGGLTQLFIAMMVTFGMGIVGKIIQKKYEN